MEEMNKRGVQNPEFHFAVLAVDIVLFTVIDSELFVRIMAVDRPPYFPKGSKGFPGGLIRPEETADDAVKRIVKNKADIDTDKIYFEQLYTFSGVKRDPRGRVVAVSYLAMVPWENLSKKEKENTPKAWWQKVGEAGELAYDHNEMYDLALRRLRSRISYTTVIQKLMPSKFTLSNLEKTYEGILGRELDKRNFRKKILKINILKELAYRQEGEPYRPAKFYKFSSSSIKEIEII